MHEGPTLDPKLAHIMPQVASMGAAVSVVDFDRDGLPDLYVTDSKEGSKNHLFRNRGNGTFEDVAERLGVADLNHAETGVSMGAVWGDYDNDGFDDLFLYRWGRPGAVPQRSRPGLHARHRHGGLPAWANVNTAVWLDFDRDGLLDLFVGGYYPESINLWKLADTHMMPESFEYANNGGRKYLFRNLGDGTIRGGQRAGRAQRRDAGRWPRSPPICAAPAIPISSSPTTTACRSSSPTITDISAKSAGTPASATRRRAG